MENKVTDIPVLKMTAKLQWDDDKKELTTTIEVKTNLKDAQLTHLIQMCHQDAPMYLSIQSDQALLPMEEALAAAGAGAADS